jgi:hypothetical protein
MAAFRNLVLFLLLGMIVMLFFARYSGVFIKPEIQIVQAGPYVAACEKHIGEYSQTGKLLKKLYDRLWDDGLENYKNLAIFFDDPQTTDVKQLRSQVGRIIEPDQNDKIERVKKNYNVFTFKQQQSAVVVLPYRNSLSLYVAIFKVYPLLKAYAIEAKVPGNHIIEIHDIDKDTRPKTIMFILPLSESGVPGLP